jgi:hypothetical protein
MISFIAKTGASWFGWFDLVQKINSYADSLICAPIAKSACDRPFIILLHTEQLADHKGIVRPLVDYQQVDCDCKPFYQDLQWCLPKSNHLTQPAWSTVQCQTPHVLFLSTAAMLA